MISSRALRGLSARVFCFKRPSFEEVSRQTVALTQEFDQPLLESVEVRSKLTRSSGVHHAATGDNADLAAKAADFLRIMTAEECGDVLFRRQTFQKVPHIAFG